MSSSNNWFGKLKTGALAAQKTAKNRLDKISETLQEKLKEAQEDLDKQRLKADPSEPVAPKLQRWRPSVDNPDGEIVTERKPPSIDQTLTRSLSESSQTPTSTADSITIPRSKRKRPVTINNSYSPTLSVPLDLETDSTNEQKNNSIKQSDNREELIPCLNDISHPIIDRETVDKSSNEFNDKISTIDELAKSTIFNTIQQNKELISIQDSTNHLENTIDREKEEYTPSKTELHQENIQTNIPTDKSTPMTNIDNPSIEHSGPENIPMEIPDNELSALMNIADSPIVDSDPKNILIKIPAIELPALINDGSSTNEHSGRENILINVPDDELLALTNIPDSLIVDSDPKNIPINVSDDELSALTTADASKNEQSGRENILINVPDDELLALTNIPDSSIVDSDPKNIPINVPSDELPTLKYTDNSLNAYPDPENIPTNVSDDELSALTTDNASTNEDSGRENIQINVPDDELRSLTTVDDSPIADFDPKNIPMNVPSDELPILKYTDNPLNAYPDPENIPINVSDDELPVLRNDGNSTNEHSGRENILINVPDDELPVLTNDGNSTNEHSGRENILINVPDDELPVLTDDDDSTNEHPGRENILLNVPNDELPALTNDDDVTNKDSGRENILINVPDDELPVLTNDSNSTNEHSGRENILINVPDEELSVLTNDHDSLIVDSGREYIPMNVPDDKLSAFSNDDNPTNEHSSRENILINVPDDELPALTNDDNSTNEHSGRENILINVPDDELPVLTDDDDSTNEHPGRENILINIPDDEIPLPPLKTIHNLSNAHPDPENISIKVPDDESLALISIDDLPIIQIDAENIQMQRPDDELPVLTHVDEIPIAHPDSENTPTDILDGESSALTNINDSPIIDSVSENIQIKVADDELLILTNMNEISIVHPDSENIPISISDNGLLTLTNIDDLLIVDSRPESIPINKSNDKLPTLTNVVESQIKHSDLNENYSIISENNIKTPPDELEDLFDELEMPNIPVHRSSEEPSPKLTHLTALREFLSKIEDDDDIDEEPISFTRDAIILNKNENTTSEQLNTSNLTKDILSLSSISISDDTPEYLANETPARSDSLNEDPSIDEKNENISTISIETKYVEKKRFSVVNCHSIPSGTKIYHINCSSTYIYLCTIDRKIFYAKLNLNDINYPFKWQQHSDLAEQIVVSVSNRTVWRLFNKHLYTSNDPIKFPPIGSQWNEIKIDNGQSLLSMSINDQCGWYIKEDGTLWLIRTDNQNFQPLNVTCPFNLNKVFSFSEKVGVTTSDGEILIRVGCTNDCLEGGGWIFIEHNFGPIDDFVLLTNNNTITFVDKKHHLWMYQWSSDKGFYEILCNDEFLMSHQKYLISVNSDLLCFTDCEEQIHIFSDCLIGTQWIVIEKNTRLQRLVGAFSNEDCVWALTTDRMIHSSIGQILEKPRQAQYLTHATFVPQNSSKNAILWTLDESCNIYVRNNLENGTQWEQADQSQFEWNRRFVNIVCNNAGVWAVDDKGHIHFRHSHISASQNVDLDGLAFLPPAWLSVPGEPERRRCFSQVFCGPADWMVYATDNKQNVYTRDGINRDYRIGTSWKLIEDCSALELAISEHTLWLLTSHGQIQCRENISVSNPIGTRSTTLPGFFLSLTVSIDDSQVWALDSQRNLLKLDRLTVLFEK